MQISTATVTTEHAASYMRKLCQHWSHKFTVELSDHHGTIQLPQALCILDASPDILTVRLEMNEGTDEPRIRKVVEEHLQRFGFREQLVFQWNPQST